MKFPRHAFLILAASALLVTAVILLLERDGLNEPRNRNASTARQVPEQESLVTERRERKNSREADRLLKAEGARTDVSLSTFPIKEYQRLPTPAGKAAGAPAGEAFIHVPSAGRRIAMESNQLGEYPAVETKLNDTVGIRLAMDSVKSGTPVRVVILDGGTFPIAEGVSQLLKTADWSGIAFEFTTSGNIGFHRVLVQAQGQPSRILNFSAHDADTWPALSTVSAN